MVNPHNTVLLGFDDTIANIALPSIQNELSVSPTTLPSIVNAYILALGGLLVFGRRLGDIIRQRRILHLGRQTARTEKKIPPSWKFADLVITPGLRVSCFRRCVMPAAVTWRLIRPSCRR
jgi:MFS family permease